jgi:hypothetical protein
MDGGGGGDRTDVEIKKPIVFKAAALSFNWYKRYKARLHRGPKTERRGIELAEGRLARLSSQL